MTIPQRAAQIWPVLTLAARNRQVLTYPILAKLIGVPQHGLTQLLGPIQAYCLAHDLPALTALVVGSDTGLPGAGFAGAPADVPAEQAKVFATDWPQCPPAEAFA